MRLKFCGFPLALCALIGVLFSCADEGEELEADKLGVGAVCEVLEDCPVVELTNTEGETEEVQLQCLDSFKGGYCGIANCGADADCPEGARCVAHTDGINYCFRTCVDKSECNVNRDADALANCSANISFVDDGGGKACVPPSA